ncbi:hypothetical protein C8J56DRAFT_408211 [Mycena floridula]|nr:hypothetical protein C8J56DRAFT_408211 [Mycena floridula]
MASKPKCPHCDKDIGFTPQVATQSHWLELQSQLRSPRIPQPSSTALIQGIEADLRRCDTEIQRQKAYVFSLQNQRKMIKRHLDAARALTAHVRKCPSEILGHIFLHLCRSTTISTEKVEIPGLTLASVCADWRRVIMSDNQLWATISLILGPSETGRSAETLTEIIQIVLEKSGNCSLAISIIHNQGDHNLQSGLSLLLEQCHRWRSLTFELEKGPISIFISHLSAIKGRIPLLEYLRLSGVKHLRGIHQIEPTSWDFLENIPKLRSAWLDDDLCSPILPLRWQQLRTVRFVCPSKLVQLLSLCSHIIDATFFGPAKFAQPITEDPVMISSIQSMTLIGTAASLKDNISILSSAMTLPSLMEFFVEQIK